MPIWTVQDVTGEVETIEAELLATEGGALVALGDDGLLARAWGSGSWRSVRLVDATDIEPADPVLVGLPRR